MITGSAGVSGNSNLRASVLFVRSQVVSGTVVVLNVLRNEMEPVELLFGNGIVLQLGDIVVLAQQRAQGESNGKHADSEGTGLQIERREYEDIQNRVGVSESSFPLVRRALGTNEVPES